TYFSEASDARNLAPATREETSGEQEVPLPMAVGHMNRAARQRRRVRRRALGMVLVLAGILLWGGAAIMRATLEDFPSEAFIYLGITVGGAAVIGGILLVST